MINFTHKLPPVLSYKTLQDKTASGAVLFFSGTHLFAKHKMFSENVFRLFFKEKIREVVVDIVRHLFSRRRTIAYQLFAKKSFGE
jgi:hypothetical protein